MPTPKATHMYIVKKMRILISKIRRTSFVSTANLKSTNNCFKVPWDLDLSFNSINLDDCKNIVLGFVTQTMLLVTDVA